MPPEGPLLSSPPNVSHFSLVLSLLIDRAIGSLSCTHFVTRSVMFTCCFYLHLRLGSSVCLLSSWQKGRLSVYPVNYFLSVSRLWGLGGCGLRVEARGLWAAGLEFECSVGPGTGWTLNWSYARPPLKTILCKQWSQSAQEMHWPLT